MECKDEKFQGKEVKPNPSQTGKDVSDILSKEDIEKLQKLKETGTTEDHVDIEAGDSKQVRKKIHQAVREGFPGLCSTTQDSNVKGRRVIRCEKEKQGYQFRSEWPRGRPPFLKFVLYKENKDTMNTIDLIAKNLRLKSRSFEYAGNKDKRAKTTQEVTVFKVSAERIHSMNRILRNISVGNYRYVTQPIRLGYLKGNKFTIILREVDASEEQIDAAKESLSKFGFINYYGMQRFGTTNIPTHYVGRALLQKDWEEATDLILRPRLGEPEEIRQCRELWQDTKDVDAVLENLPKSYGIEWLLLHGLKKTGTLNYYQAFTMVPRNSRLMYVHSYQSYIWNRIVSKRIRSYGLAVIQGDLVMDRESLKGLDSFEEEDLTWEETMRLLPVVITPSNIRRYRIEDVVLPLPGYAVRYPENPIRMWYEEMLREDNLTIKGLQTNHKDYSLPGAYRRIVVKPGNLTCQSCMYDDYTLPLVLSDVDKIKGVELPEGNPLGGKHKAVKVEMTLPTSSYATMALREMLKTDTSAAHQSTLNTRTDSGK